ncbi:MAG: nucleotidyltransferase family protein [Elusimicrobia bacterium]|nr:nucleotidyltransferase family protein [Elusimicrobiota bacterium]
MEQKYCRLLIDCLKNDKTGLDVARLSSLSTEHWQAFLALAKTQRVMPLLWHRLRQKGLERAVPAAAAKAFREAARRNTLHNLRYYGELRLLLSAMKREGMPLILLKGIYLAEAVYDEVGLREMNDIDVLARPADLTRISDILAAMGYTPLQPICADTTLKMHHHLPRMVKNGYASFEIHWNLTGPGKSYSMDPGGLWKRAVPGQITGCDALSLAPEDLLLHLCLHTSYHHQFAFGLRPSCDIAETILRFGSALDWQTVAERAVSQGWQRGVYLALRLAGELAGASVPDDILARLRPADMEEAVLETARAQVFTDKSFAFSVPVSFAELLNSKRLWDKIRIFWQRVFLPRPVIAEQYSVPMDSVKIYGCYPRRFIDVLRRHGRTLKKFHENDALLKALVARTNHIANWLAGPTEEPVGRSPRHSR